MKNFKLLLAAVLLFIMSCSFGTSIWADNTNDFYDEGQTYVLPYAGPLTVQGEVKKPQTIDLLTLPLRSVITKEAILDKGKPAFVGAYTYEGYSLYDILNHVVIKKRADNTFKPMIDLYVEIANAKGESTILSWSEIYYARYPHQILLATKVRRIVPSKSKQLWPLPTEAKLVIGNDLLTERNISSPTTITIKSAKWDLPVNKGMKPMHAPSFNLYNNSISSDTQIATITSLANYPKTKYETIYYGRGRGIHGTSPFEGVQLKDLLFPYYPCTKENLQKGLFIVAAKDGYHGVMTYSELMNRNDQSEVLVVDNPIKNVDRGRFSLFKSSHFFSDYAIASLNHIIFKKIKTEEKINSK